MNTTNFRGDYPAISLAKLAARNDKNLGTPGKEALEAYQAELKGTELEPDLLRARIITAMQDGDFGLATDLIEDFTKLVRTSQKNLVLDELGSAIHAIENDAKFLKEAVSLPPEYFRKIAEEIQKRIEDRVIQLGFGEFAAQLGKMPRNIKQALASKPNTLRSGERGVPEDPDQSVISAAKPVKTDDPTKIETRDDKQVDSATNPRILTNSSPLTKAVRDTQEALSGMAALKAQLADLGI